MILLSSDRFPTAGRASVMDEYFLVFAKVNDQRFKLQSKSYKMVWQETFQIDDINIPFIHHKIALRLIKINWKSQMLCFFLVFNPMPWLSVKVL